MPTIEKNKHYTVLVHLETHPGKQQSFIDAITEQIRLFIQFFPGFISANFLKADDGKTVFNYAQWQSKADYENFLETNPQKTKEVIEKYVVEIDRHHPLTVAETLGK